jgi:hypothetical protein
MPIVRALLPTALFLVALAGTCSAIRMAQPFPKVLGIYQKWLYYQKHKEEIDLLFIGSSRVYHSVIPQQFDARVKEAGGGELRSFNFGYDAMWPPESLYMTRQILSVQPSRLRWIVLECLDIYADLNEETRYTRRTAYWHDWTHTRMAWEAIADQQYDPVRSWDLLTAHGEILTRNWMSQGRGAELLGYRFGVERQKKASRWEPPDAWKHSEGYEPEDDQPLAGSELDRFVRATAERRKKFPPVTMRPSLKRAYLAILEEIKRAGIQPIVLITPTVRADENFSGFPPDVPVWSYHDPNEYPGLYEPANRHDFTHLNHAGAELLTTLLGQRFAAYRKGKL